MSAENVELVRRWWEEIEEWFDESGRDRDVLRQIPVRYMAEDVVYEEDPAWPDAGTYRGRDAVIDRFLEYLDTLGMRRIELGDVLDAGDQVVLEGRIYFGAGSDAGESLSYLWGYTVRVEDGRVAHFRAWIDPAEGRRAAGLS